MLPYLVVICEVKGSKGRVPSHERRQKLQSRVGMPSQSEQVVKQVGGGRNLEPSSLGDLALGGPLAGFK